MIILQCTNKLQKVVESERLPLNIEVDNNLYCWHGNYFYLNEQIYFILMNDLTFYSFIILDEEKDFKTIVMEKIRHNLIENKVHKNKIEFYLNRRFYITETNNRRVLGKMNSMIKIAKLHLELGENLEEVNLKLGYYESINKKYAFEIIREEFEKTTLLR